MLAEIASLAKERYVSPLQPAMIRFALGEIDAGFRLLSRAVEERSVNLQLAAIDPSFDAVRRDPRFIRLREQLRLPEAAWATSLLGK